MITSIIIELLGTKMGECNEKCISNIKLMMHIKATMQFLRRVCDNINLNPTKMHSFISYHMQFYKWHNQFENYNNNIE